MAQITLTITIPDGRMDDARATFDMKLGPSANDAERQGKLKAYYIELWRNWYMEYQRLSVDTGGFGAS